MKLCVTYYDEVVIVIKNVFNDQDPRFDAACHPGFTGEETLISIARGKNPSITTFYKNGEIRTRHFEPGEYRADQLAYDQLMTLLQAQNIDPYYCEKDPLEALTIAKWFLSKGSMTVQKLQRLVYYSYAWYLVKYNESPDQLNDRLFNDPIQAYTYGPGMASILVTYRYYLPEKIPQKPFEGQPLSPKVLDVLEEVWKTYGDWTAEELEAISRNEAAYKAAREGFDPVEMCSRILDDQLIFNTHSSH